MRYRLLAVLALVLVAILAACSDLTAPNGAVPILPIPAEYRAWWSELEACSGKRGDIDAVRFYVVAALPHGRIGQATIKSDQTVILFVRGHQNFDTPVKHEMMHALLRVGGHPAEYFAGPCGNLGLN